MIMVDLQSEFLRIALKAPEEGLLKYRLPEHDRNMNRLEYKTLCNRCPAAAWSRSRGKRGQEEPWA